MLTPEGQAIDSLQSEYPQAISAALEKVVRNGGRLIITNEQVPILVVDGHELDQAPATILEVEVKPEGLGESGGLVYTAVEVINLTS